MQMDRNTSTEGKDTINNWIIPFLRVGKRDPQGRGHNRSSSKH